MFTNDIVSFEQLGPGKYFLSFLHINIYCGYSLDAQWGTSNEYLQQFFMENIKKKKKNFFGW